MSALNLARSEPDSLLTHMALYGLAAMAADAGCRDLRLGWSSGMCPRPWIDPGAGERAEALAGIVQAHARRHAPGPRADERGSRSWILEDIVLDGKDRGLMSPRLTAIGDDPEGWRALQKRRHEVLDRLTQEGARLDLRYVAALGEPAYWRFDRQGKPRQDDAASRFEMQPRNQGSEFVRNKLRKVAETIGTWSEEQVLAGLTGASVTDEIGGASSLSATGLALPGPVDNALLWCALWGISQVPLNYYVHRRAGTACALEDCFYAPLWQGNWRPTRLRSILTSKPLADLARYRHAPSADDEEGTRDLVAQEAAPARWLARRGVVALFLFPVRVYGSKSAPERGAQRGEIHVVMP